MPRRLLEGGQVLPAKAHPRTHRRRDGHCSDNWLRRYWIPALASLRSLGRNDGEHSDATWARHGAPHFFDTLIGVGSYSES